mmetsp:Transcript_20484/g.32091  ORF Transcript_20484/g.32091 Transcript_20484/m.32091 type:complete len:217 (+) Transcript_20484:233-883(+)
MFINATARISTSPRTIMRIHCNSFVTNCSTSTSFSKPSTTNASTNTNRTTQNSSTTTITSYIHINKPISTNHHTKDGRKHELDSIRHDCKHEEISQPCSTSVKTCCTNIIYSYPFGITSLVFSRHLFVTKISHTRRNNFPYPPNRPRTILIYNHWYCSSSFFFFPIIILRNSTTTQFTNLTLKHCTPKFPPLHIWQLTLLLLFPLSYAFEPLFLSM